MQGKLLCLHYISSNCTGARNKERKQVNKLPLRPRCLALLWVEQLHRSASDARASSGICGGFHPWVEADSPHSPQG